MKISNFKIHGGKVHPFHPLPTPLQEGYTVVAPKVGSEKL